MTDHSCLAIIEKVPAASCDQSSMMNLHLSKIPLSCTDHEWVFQAANEPTTHMCSRLQVTRPTTLTTKKQSTTRTHSRSSSKGAEINPDLRCWGTIENTVNIFEKAISETKVKVISCLKRMKSKSKSEGKRNTNKRRCDAWWWRWIAPPDLTRKRSIHLIEVHKALHVSVLVVIDCLSMVSCQEVGKRGRYWFSSRTLYMSMKIAVKHVEQVLSQVHVSDGVDLFVSVNEDTPWFLAISMTPQMFDTFHVPLVHNSHNSFTSTLIYLSE